MEGLGGGDGSPGGKWESDEEMGKEGEADGEEDGDESSKNHPGQSKCA